MLMDGETLRTICWIIIALVIVVHSWTLRKKPQDRGMGGMG
jgi:hypothetical protein